MKKHFYLPLIILLSLAISNCQGSRTSQLEATNEALSNQISTLMAQITQPAISPSKPTQGPISVSTESAAPTELPLASASPLPPAEAGVIAPGLIYSGSGEITPWSNPKAYQPGLFGTANVHMVSDPNDSAAGKVWIDDKNFSVSCPANSESWFPWKQEITVGDHYIYSANANDKYEFWTIGSTPFTIRNKFSRSDFIFLIKNPGIYNLSANLIKGAFNLYITCEVAQNFTYEITASTTIQVVMRPAQCKLLIRDTPPGTLTPGEIEVSLEFAK